MILPGHLAGGYLAAQLVLAIGHPAGLSGQETLALSVIGMLAGELPDIDLVWLYFKHRKSTKKGEPNHHREYITHIPLFWLIIGLIIVGLGGAANSIFTQYIGWIIWVGTWSHFLLDSIEHGVPWLFPFSKKRFCLMDTPGEHIDARTGSLDYHWKFVREQYIRRISFYAEILVVVVAVVFVFK